MKRLITWIYIRFVVLPYFRKMDKQCADEMQMERQWAAQFEKERLRDMDVRTDH